MGSRVLHILVAEDNFINQKLLKTLLKQLGHTGMVVENGQQALQCLKEHRFDVVLMDVMMPVMDGLQALQHIRRQEQSTGRHQPVVMVTAHTQPEDEAAMLRAGADGYLPKPVRLEALQKVLAGF
nr:response regulator [uncultured Rhodoferax sp.]